MPDPDIWLSLPKAALAFATGDVAQAIALSDAGAAFALAHALPPLLSEPLRVNAGKGEARAALRRGRHRLAVEPRGSPADRIFGALWAALAAGCTAKGRRSENAPLETIDPAEFFRLVPSGANAALTNGRVVWYDLHVSAIGIFTSPVSGSGDTATRTAASDDPSALRKRGPRPRIYDETLKAMRQTISKGKHTVESLRTATEEALASEFGVSRTTVRKARKQILVSNTN